MDGTVLFLNFPCIRLIVLLLQVSLHSHSIHMHVHVPWKQVLAQGPNGHCVSHHFVRTDSHELKSKVVCVSVCVCVQPQPENLLLCLRCPWAVHITVTTDF